jgi:hypothetical protein
MDNVQNCDSCVNIPSVRNLQINWPRFEDMNMSEMTHDLVKGSTFFCTTKELITNINK